jgi:hypothetical protein
MTFNDPGNPSGGDSLPLKDVLGSLLLFTVRKETDTIDTEYGPNTAIAADVAVLDGPHKGDTYADTLIWPRVLKGQLRGSIGGMVLGRLEQGEKKPGKNPPWRLAPATDADKAVGEKYLAYVESQKPAVEEPGDEEPF